MIERCLRFGEAGEGFTYQVCEPNLFMSEIRERNQWLTENTEGWANNHDTPQHVSWHTIYYFKRYCDAFAFHVRFRGTARGGRSEMVTWIG